MRARLAAMLGVFGIALLAGAAPVIAAPGAVPDTSAFEIESFDADYTLTRDPALHAQLRVVETIVAVFPEFDQNRGLIRDIPEYYDNVQLHTAVESVVDENGDPVPYETEYYQDAFSVLLGDDSFVHGRTTYVITYTQQDTIRTTFTDTDFDEFYWDVNGTLWSQPFLSVTATLHVPPELSAALSGTAACFQGPNLSTEECSGGIGSLLADDGSTTFTASAEGLLPNQGLTIAVGFAEGTFVEGAFTYPPSSGDDDYDYPDDEYESSPPLPAWLGLSSALLGGLSVLLGIVARTLRSTHQSNETRASDIIVPQYTPPEGLNVMLAAYLIGRPKTAFPAQIVDLAVRKKLRLLDHPDDLDNAPFGAELLDTSELAPLEQRVVDALFGKKAPVGTRRALVPNDTALGLAFGPIHRELETELRTENLRAGSRPTGPWMILLGLTIAIVVFELFAFLGSLPYSDNAPLWLGGVAAFFGFSLVSGAQSTVATLTYKGRARNDYLLGMKMYLELAEEDRLRMLQSPEGAERVDVPRIDPNDKAQMVKLYEDLLPWAVIWGVEDKWSEELAIRAQEAKVPVTFVAGTSDFSSWSIRSTLNGISRATPDPPPAVITRARNSSSNDSSSFWSGGSGGWGGGGGSFSGGSSSSFSGGGGFSGGRGGGGGGRGR
ncbi:MAG: DUF2207 domain-containing protein [Pseudolysinimonas sp.]